MVFRYSLGHAWNEVVGVEVVCCLRYTRVSSGIHHSSQPHRIIILGPGFWIFIFGSRLVNWEKSIHPQSPLLLCSSRPLLCAWKLDWSKMSRCIVQSKPDWFVALKIWYHPLYCGSLLSVKLSLWGVCIYLGTKKGKLSTLFLTNWREQGSNECR